MYMIRSLINMGYWDSDAGRFHGMLYGDKYATKQEAEDEITLYITEPCEIIKVYVD